MLLVGSESPRTLQRGAKEVITCKPKKLVIPWLHSLQLCKLKLFKSIAGCLLNPPKGMSATIFLEGPSNIALQTTSMSKMLNVRTLFAGELWKR